MKKPNFYNPRPQRGWMYGAALLLPLAAFSWNPGVSGRFYGQSAPMGNGTARTYVVMDDGKPVELGIALSEQAMEGLPAQGHGHGPHANFTQNILALPAEAAGLGFQTVELDWNPAGHEPPGIYDIPHFDFHFYTISNDERLAMTPADAEFQQKAARYPAADLVPRGYVSPAPVAIPQMGVHWVDPTSGELNGKRFTNTFIYGSYDGRLIFAEPMITREFLLTKPDVTLPVGVAARYEGHGWHPTAYRISWDAESKEYRIALTGFAPNG
ncbi:MAG TPA: DUF5602 domain-containing protein [Longimicrobium sp.]|nr:DUF5602 domain-containing protein [Longimicrobium sp.]